MNFPQPKGLKETWRYATMCILLVFYSFLSKCVTTFFMILAAFSETRVHDIYPQVQEALQRN